MAARKTPFSETELAQHKNKGADKKTGALQIQTMEKALQAMNLRKSGLTYEKICEEMGVSLQYARHLVVKGMKLIVQDTAKEIIAMENERLNVLWLAAFSRVEKQLQNDAPVSKDMIESCIKVMDRRAKLLGLDKPVKITHTDEDGKAQKMVPSFVVNMVGPTEKGIIDAQSAESGSELHPDAVPGSRPEMPEVTIGFSAGEEYGDRSGDDDENQAAQDVDFREHDSEGAPADENSGTRLD